MCKDKNMFALIIVIFISVLLITGWVFADHTMVELINVTPIFELKNTASAPEALPDLPVMEIPANGMCTIDDICG